MAVRRKYIPIAAPTLGLVTSTPSSMLEGRATPDCNEMRFGVGVAEKMPGWVQFGLTLANAVLAIDKVNSTTLVFTSADVYKYDSGVFTSIKDVGYTTGAKGLISSAYYELLYVFTNGIDSIKSWDGSAAAILDLTGATAYITKWLLIFGERLCLYNLVDTGTARADRVRWSVVGDITTWSGTGSGFADIATNLENFDTIQRAEKLGNVVVIYGKHSIAQQGYTGDPDNPFTFGMRVNGKGLAASRALVNIEGRGHFFLGWEDVYAYNGGVSVTPIGKEITDELFQRINMSAIDTSFMVYVRNKKRIRLHVPLDGATTPNYYYELNTDEESWTRGARELTGFGYGEESVATTWDALATLGTTWDDVALTWNELEGNAGREKLFYGDSGGKVYEDGVSKSSSGVAVDSYMDTKDFVSAGRYENDVVAWMELNVEATGDALTIQYSTDGGINFTDLKTLTLTNRWVRYRVDMEVYSRQVRFRFKNNTAKSTFSLRFIEVGYVGGTVQGEEEGDD